MNIKTVSIKGSKRKLLDDILKLVQEVDGKNVLDGFSGSGIVSAYLRGHGYLVTANDKMVSANLYSRVFLEGFNQKRVTAHIKHINALSGNNGWITKNYSGSVQRTIRGTKGKVESRPLGFTINNAMKLDVARDYADTIKNKKDRNAVIFSIIMAMNKVFNGSTDQKSCLKVWSPSSLKDVVFEIPSLIAGSIGRTYSGNVLDLKKKDYDVVYLDPPYTHGVLYDACYHLDSSVASWKKPILDTDYAIPRPKEVCFRKNKALAGEFYSKASAKSDFKKLLGMFKTKRIILSYSDAPRNVLSYDELVEICSGFGNLTVKDRSHKICSQSNSQKKVSTNLKEFFFIIDLTN